VGYRILVGIPKGKSPLETPTLRWENAVELGKQDDVELGKRDAVELGKRMLLN
jgi:hypothetical protein